MILIKLLNHDHDDARRPAFLFLFSSFPSKLILLNLSRLHLSACSHSLLLPLFYVYIKYIIKKQLISFTFYRLLFSITIIIIYIPLSISFVRQISIISHLLTAKTKKNYFYSIWLTRKTKTNPYFILITIPFLSTILIKFLDI